MKTSVLSVNASEAENMDWQGQSVVSSMNKKPLAGPLLVSPTGIEGDLGIETGLEVSSAAEVPTECLLYAIGVSSALVFYSLMHRSGYQPGSLGEHLTLKELDEKKVSVGDIFQIGEVQAQVVFPRIPTLDLNLRLRHSKAAELMKKCGRSGVFLRVLKPGAIKQNSECTRIEGCAKPIWIADLYKKIVNNEVWTLAEIEQCLQNEFHLQNWRCDLERRRDLLTS